jgi:RNA polymerase sigma-70 factor, ECF subfamily
MSGCPSERLRRKELAIQIREIVDELNESDREIVLLRFVEELSNAEVAELLGIEPEAARKRHGRALRRLFEKMVERGINNTK